MSQYLRDMALTIRKEPEFTKEEFTKEMQGQKLGLVSTPIAFQPASLGDIIKGGEPRKMGPWD